MSWAIGYDSNWQRDIGYGVPAYCDYPKCAGEIDRGLSYVCGGAPYGGEHGCGLFFCSAHLAYRWRGRDVVPVQLCPRCARSRSSYKRIAPEHPTWLQHKLTDDSWAAWRNKNPREVEAMTAALALSSPLAPADGGGRRVEG